MDFLAENMCKLHSYVVRSSYLASVWNQLRALNMTSCWLYAVRTSIFCVKRFTDMPWSTCNRLVQKKKESFSPTEMHGHSWPFWRPVVGGDTCSPLLCSASPTVSPNERNDYATLFHCSRRSLIPNTRYQVREHSTSYCMPQSWRTLFGATSLNRLVDYWRKHIDETRIQQYTSIEE